MNDSSYAMRPEAGPVRFGSLNRSQRNALKAIVAVMTEAADQAKKSNESNDPDHDVAAIEVDRVSRLFFVSGQPGSGKSSLYVTLRAILSRDERYDVVLTEYQAKLSTQKETSPLSNLAGKLRWLEPIDLEVAGDEGENLLAAMLVRISDAIRDSLGAASKKCREALEQLEELANDIGIAWDGNLKDRASSLDPDNYSQEVMRAQRTRLYTNTRLRRALDTLLRNQCYTFRDEQLFVLPIDDFYLKPTASLALLRLLRMISVPRLFFLIMGDIKTVEALFFEKALADWTKVAGAQVFATLEDRKDREVLPRAREMKARYLRKLIPAGQRAVIDWTEWDEALGFKRPALAQSDKVPPLHHLLSNVPICWENGPNGDTDHNLLNYLIFPDILKEKGDDCSFGVLDPEIGNRDTTKKLREAYSGLQILDATPRELLDLWMRLQKKFDPCDAPYGRGAESNGESGKTSGQTTADVDKPAPSYLRMVVECAIPAIEEQDFLTEEDQDILRFVFPGSYRDDLWIETDRLRLEQKSRPWRNISSGDVVVRRHRDWRLGILGPEAQPHGQIKKQGLPPRLAAWIILLHDLAWNWNCESISENLVDRLRTQIGEHRIAITPKMAWPNAKALGWAWYKDKDEDKKDVWVHFPLHPKLDTFRQLDRFLMIWNYRLKKKHPKSLRDTALNWVDAAWRATVPDKKDFVAQLETQSVEDREKTNQAEWKTFIEDFLSRHLVLKRLFENCRGK